MQVRSRQIFPIMWIGVIAAGVSHRRRVFCEDIYRGQRSKTVRKRARFPAGCTLKQAVALLYNLYWSEITVYFCCSLLRFVNWRQCPSVWAPLDMTKPHTHMLFLFLSWAHRPNASLWTTLSLRTTGNGIRRKWKCELHILYTLHVPTESFHKDLPCCINIHIYSCPIVSRLTMTHS